jgi:hypothetical protein
VRFRQELAVRRYERPCERNGVIRTSVVDKDHLARRVEAGEVGVQRLQSSNDARRFVEDGYND